MLLLYKFGLHDTSIRTKEGLLMSDKLTHSADTPKISDDRLSRMSSDRSGMPGSLRRHAFPESGNGCRHCEPVGHDQSLWPRKLCRGFRKTGDKQSFHKRRVNAGSSGNGPNTTLREVTILCTQSVMNPTNWWGWSEGMPCSKSTPFRLPSKPAAW